MINNHTYRHFNLYSYKHLPTRFTSLIAVFVQYIGGAVIIVPPLNVTRLEGDKLEMPCEARGLPGNFSVTWFRENHAVRSIPWLESRTLLKRDGTLVISPVHSDDRGLYSCEVTNGIGDPQRASAYIEVECKYLC